jgi:hypothetical protein
MKRLTTAERRLVYERSNKHCHVCGDSVNFEDCQIDHIWPLDLGGNNDSDNLLPAHPVCNHLKWHNDPPTIQRMLFLGMLANSHAYIDLTEFGQDVRQQRAARLAENWQTRELAKLSKSGKSESHEIAKITSQRNKLYDDFMAFEAEVIKHVKRTRASRRDRTTHLHRAEAPGGGIEKVRTSRRHDWQRALDAMISDLNIPTDLRYAYREFARLEERSTPDELL